MNTKARKTVPVAPLIPAFVFIGFRVDDLLLMSFGGVLMLCWSIFELYNPINRRRTLAALYGV